MKTWICSVLFCVAALSLVSCVEEEFLESGAASDTFSLSVTQEGQDQTKLAFGDDFLTTYWENGDQLILRKVDDATRQYTLTTTLDQPSRTAVFTHNGALRGGTYYVYNFGGTDFGQNPIRLSRDDMSLHGQEMIASYRMALYGIITIKTGDTSASVELKQAYSMLRFSFNDPGGKLAKHRFISGIGMVAPKKGFIQEMHLQPDGTFSETKSRQAMWSVYGEPSLNPDRTQPSIEDSRALIIPVDLSGEDVYFYVSYVDHSDDANPVEKVFEMKKSGINLRAGVCYNITLNLANAIEYDLSDHKLDCPGDFRALAYDPMSSLVTTRPYEVTQDIDFNGIEFFPITPSGTHTRWIQINGNNKTLSNISINWPFDGAGLIGWGSICKISNLNIDKADIKGQDYVGGFIGYGYSSSTQNCKLTNSTIRGNKYVGGIYGGPSPDAGYNSGCSIKTCYVNNSTITATSSYVGGIAGKIPYVSGSEVDVKTKVNGNDFAGGITGSAVATVSDCSSAATVIASNYVGGILGEAGSIEVMYTSNGNAVRCANTGNVTGKDYVGGIVGYARAEVAINESYSTGTISGTNYIGGIAGYAYQPIKNCYNLGAVSGDAYVGGIVGQWYSAYGDKYRIKYCYSAGNVSSGRGIIGGFTADNYATDAYIDCITTSSEIGDRRKADSINRNPEHTGLTNINSKIDLIDKDEVYFPDRVWDTALYPNYCTILLWQGNGFGLEVTAEN